MPVFGVATKMNIPTVLHESNAYPGRAVKMFAKSVSKVLCGFSETKEFLENQSNVVVTGTPTKISKINFTYTEKIKILKEYDINPDIPVVLVFGGSQGAQKINDVVYDIIKNGLNKKYQIIWATGPKQYDIIKERFLKDSFDINKLENVKAIPYIYNMNEMMNIADVFVCRSGAMTITEVSIVGRPAIFIPLPSKMANRQEDNAKVLEKIGAAKIILNDVVDCQNLNENITSIISNKILLNEMGKMANTLAPKNVEDKIYEEIKKIVK